MAATDATVFLLGETGAGKELLARAIHAGAGGAAGDGVGELRGHSRDPDRERAVRPREGRLHGAPSRQLGRFELADRATIFLDEIGELPLDVQVKLLRVLEERQFERLGGSKADKMDVR